MTLHRNVALLAMFFTGSSLSSAPSANGQSPAVPKGVVMVKAGEVQWQDYPGRTGVKLAVILGDPAKPGPFIMRVRFP